MMSNVFKNLFLYKNFLYLVVINVFLIACYLTYNNFYLNNKRESSSSSSSIYFDIRYEYPLNHTNVNTTSIDQQEDEFFPLLLNYIQNWKKSLNSGNTPLITHLSFINDAHKLIIKEQELEPFNVTERPIALNETLDCRNLMYSSFLTSAYRKKSARITDLILISYELVVVEMRLFELYDVVDEIIIFETNITFKQVAKPFFFLSNLSRYKRFLDKIVLITPFNVTRFNPIDLSIRSQINISLEDIPQEYRVFQQAPDVAFNKNQNTEFFKIDFTIEQRARMMPLSLYEKYVRRLEDDELIIHGDIDEMPSGMIINHFKYCQVLEERYPFQFWSTFYIYGFNFLFRADFAAPGDPYSNAYPNIFRMKDIRRLGKIRLNKAYLLPRASGCHCNRFFSGFTISLYKDMSQSDSEGLENFHSTIIQNATIEACYDIKTKFLTGNVYEKYLNRMKPTKDLLPHETIFIPWIVLANKHVYKQYISN